MSQQLCTSSILPGGFYVDVPCNTTKKVTLEYTRH